MDIEFRTVVRMSASEDARVYAGVRKEGAVFACKVSAGWTPEETRQGIYFASSTTANALRLMVIKGTAPAYEAEIAGHSVIALLMEAAPRWGHTAEERAVGMEAWLGALIASPMQEAAE